MSYFKLIFFILFCSQISFAESGHENCHGHDHGDGHENNIFDGGEEVEVKEDSHDKENKENKKEKVDLSHGTDFDIINKDTKSDVDKLTNTHMKERAKQMEESVKIQEQTFKAAQPIFNELQAIERPTVSGLPKIEPVKPLEVEDPFISIITTE